MPFKVERYRKWCEDPRHSEKRAKGKGGRRSVGTIATKNDTYAVCESCLERISKAEGWED